MANLFDIIKKFGQRVAEAQQDNRESQTEKTADGSVFDDIRSRIDNMNKRDQAEAESSRSPFDDFKRELDEVQTHNRENPNVETAESSVFDKMRAEIERMEAEAKAGSGGTGVFEEEHSSNMPYDSSFDEVVNTPPPPAARVLQVGGMANISSGGGSLGMRISPDMGAGKNSTRIPSGAEIRILEYTDQNKINLDGKISGWYKVDYNGQQGWILENYLI